MRRLTVLTVGNRYPPAGSGGYERIWADGVAALRGAGHDVRVLTTEGGPATGGVWRELRWYWRDHAWVRPSLLNTIALERHNAAVLARRLAGVDVVSWWGMGGLSLGLLERVRRAGVPAVGVVADGWMVYGPHVDAWLARPCARLRERLTGLPARVDLGEAAEWLFISEAVRRRAPRPAQQALANPGVDPERFPFSPAGEWRWRLLCAGRVEPAKGVADAIRALAALPPAATLTVDGRGDDGHRRELEGLAAACGVAHRIRWQESPPEALPAVYASHDCVLFPVVWEEPWGLVPLEAMSVGRPVVATATGGTAEYFADGDNGLRVGPGRPAELAAAVERLASDPELRARLVAGGRRTAARHTAAAFERVVVDAHERAAAKG